MLRSLARRLLGALLDMTPLAVRDRLFVHLLSRTTDAVRFRTGVPAMGGTLLHLAASGFAPRHILDIGACVGDWAMMASRAYPEAHMVLIDGNPENGPALQHAVQQIGPRARHRVLLLGPTPREEVPFSLMAGGGSSVLMELTTIERRTIRVPMGTLDELFADEPLDAPLLLKLDVQGFELEVLRGGLAVLERAEVVILEIALLPYNQGAPLFAEVVAFMEQAGLVVYDFCGQWRRQTDHTLFQTDVVFVRHTSALRARRRFWLNEPANAVA
jgi:FkbM family methyltransferase